MKRALRFINREEGVSMIVIMLISVALLLTVPVFVDYASLHYTRRVAQTGADAAALAAAISYAEEFSVYWGYGDGVLGFVAMFLCCDTPCMAMAEQCVVLFYTLHVLIYGNMDSIGEGDAEDYAEANDTEMQDYDAAPFPFMFYNFPRIILIEYIPVPPVGVDVTVSREAPMIYGQLYGEDEFVVEARAIAEAYLDEAEDGRAPCIFICCSCPYCICPASVPTYDFTWKVRLVE